MSDGSTGAAHHKSRATRDAGSRPSFGIAPGAGLLVLTLSALIFFFHLGTYGLWEPDEARYAEIAREMLQLRDFVLPHLNYVAYVEKPPLLYWLTSLCFAGLGPSEFAARLIPALCALAGVAATFLFARRCFGWRHAAMAAAVLATAPLYFILAQVLLTDMLLTAMVTVAIFALFLHYRDGGGWCWLAYAAMGLATLTKGPVGIILPAASMGLFLLWEGQLRGAIRRFHAVAGFSLIAVIAAPWFLAISLKEPGFVDFYFVGEYFKRALVPTFSHGQPMYYYIPVIIGGLLPWSLLVPFLTWRRMPPNPARRFCVITSIVIVGIFSLASGKLIPYVLPAFPPLAVLIADGIVSCAWPAGPQGSPLLAPDSRILVESGPLLGLLGAGAIIVAIEAARFRVPYPMMVRPALCAVGAILIGGGAFTTAAFLLKRAGAGLVALVLTLALSLCAGTWGRIEAEPMHSYAALSRTVAERAPHATLICYRRYVQSLPFYNRRRVILVGPLTELRFGAERARDAADFFFTTDAQFLSLWNRPGQSVAVLDDRDLARLKNRLGTFTVIAREEHKLAIVNRSEQLVSY